MNPWPRRYFLLAVLLGPLSAQAAPRLGDTTLPGAGRLSHPATSATRRSEPDGTVTLIEAALAADPLAVPQTGRRMSRAIRSLLVRQRRNVDPLTSSRNRAHDAFDLLQAQLLNGRYDPGCARLQRTLEDGTHNCLTGSLLYLSLCRAVGVPATAVASPGHVAVRIWIDGQAHDIETTDRRWHPHPEGASGRYYVQISDRALLGRVHYNLGILFAREGHLDLALAATRQSYRLDPTHLEARRNLLATLNNRSIELARRGEFRRAEALIREGLQLDNEYAPLRRSEAFVRQRRET